MVRIGARAHDFGRGDAGFIGRAAAAAGAACLQLAPAKALADCPPLPGLMGREWARSVAETLSSYGVSVAVLGCYVDACSEDPASRASATARIAHNLSIARDFGAAVVATETPLAGNRASAARGYLRATIRDLMPVAAGAGSRLCVEPVWGHAIATPRDMAELLRDIGSDSLGAVLDPANLFDPGSGLDPSSTALEAVELFGSSVAAVHVKDFVVRGGAKIPAVPGTGDLDWARIAEAAALASPAAPFIIEDQDAAGFAAGAALLASIFS